MKKNNNNAILIAIVALLIGAVGGFFGGTYYQKSQRVSFAGGMNGGGGARMMYGEQRNGAGFGGGATNGGAMGLRPVTGEITSADAKSITVKLADGSSKIVVFSDKTAINKADKASTSDLKTGTKVMVVGQTNSDGSVTAQDIQLNPIMRTAPANNQSR